MPAITSVLELLLLVGNVHDISRQNIMISSKLVHQEEEVIQADMILRGNVAAMPWRVAIRH